EQRVRDACAEASSWRRILDLGWIAVAIVFTLLAWDEVASLHERIDELPLVPTLLVSIPGIGAWAGALVVPIILIAAGLIAFALVELRRVPLALALVVLGTLLLLSIPLQEHVEALMRAESNMRRAWQRPILFVLLEEGAELGA